ncbi:hypothetical protein L3Q82_008913 [Scortum barcoo]|uniref:Uncharacterized protein n=1 Tax=Scortum barcoo TaxID=214431 RepID=A0ACB8XDY6_9TELE|nr:hypothetical protein L3Q82_008913 [Scortum barcoo]
MWRCVMFLALLALGSVVAAAARLPGTCSGLGVDLLVWSLSMPEILTVPTTFETLMTCQVEAQNCSEYNLTLVNDSLPGEESCVFSQCDSGGCCCSFKMILILGETHKATVYKGGKKMESKIIGITESRKPKAPTITSVKESEGYFEIMWTTNMDQSYNSRMSANVTYHKKGDPVKVSIFIQLVTVNGLQYYQIPVQDLEPSTTYMVSVQSYTDFSGRFSDSSEEWEFTTPKSPMSTNVLLLGIIIILSVVAVILSGAIYSCYVMLKKKWWDTVAKCPNPKLFIIHSGNQEILKPVSPLLSSVYAEPLIPDDNKLWSKGLLKDTSSGSLQHSSGISTGSSCLSYANAEPVDIIAGVQDALDKVFANISPISPLTTNPHIQSNKDSGLFSAPYNSCSIRADDINSGSSNFDNKTYSIVLPICLCEITTDRSEVQTETEMLCESAYHPSEGDNEIYADQQTPACPLVNLPPMVSSLMPTDMSYQQCNAESGRRSYAEDSSLSSVSSCTNTTASCDPVLRVEAGYESFDEGVGGATKPNRKTEEAIICDENPCYSCGPAASQSFPSIDDDYQAFQSLVQEPDMLPSDERCGEKEEHLNIFPEKSFTKMPHSFLSPVVPGFVNSVQGDQCHSEVHSPFLALIPAYQSMPVMADNGYQSV